MLGTVKNHDALKPLRFVFQVYLWLSVGLCLALAVTIGMISQNENAKLFEGALVLFAGLGVAFARSWRRIERPRWWHWVLGATLVAPAVVAFLLPK